MIRIVSLAAVCVTIRGVALGFNEYPRSGVAITLLSLAAGVAWLSLVF